MGHVLDPKREISHFDCCLIKNFSVLLLRSIKSLCEKNNSNDTGHVEEDDEDSKAVLSPFVTFSERIWDLRGFAVDKGHDLWVLISSH